MHHPCLIGLGTNLGNRLKALQDACDLIQPILSQLSCSLVYETNALLPDNAKDEWDRPYLNMVVYGNTSLAPEELFQHLKTIEKQMGRDHKMPKWSPRIIDCDILLYGNSCIETQDLTIPHPEFAKRFFTMIPAAQIAPQWIHPKLNQPLIDIARTFSSTQFLRSYVLNPKFLGIVNVTPNSFSDGGQFLEPEKAIDQARNLWNQGASIIDFGAQSKKPSGKSILWGEEWQRLEPVLSGFTSICSDALISIDTFRYEVAKQCFKKFKIHWINDVSGNLDPDLIKLVADYGASYVITCSESLAPEKMLLWAKQQITTCLSCGLKQDQIIFDPGIGFKKAPLDTFYLLNQIDCLKQLGVKTLIGISRKPFWRICLDDPTYQADFISVTVASMLKKIDYFRVHDVNGHQRGFALAHLLNSFSVAK